MINIKNIPNREYVFGAIFALANRLQTLGDKIDENITVKQWFFIAVVSMYDSPSIGDISKYIGSSRQNIKKMALLLQEKEFVTIQEDSSDKRISRIILTEKCFTYFKTRQSMEEDFIKSLFNGFSEKNIEDLSNSINSLMRNLEEMEKIDEKEG